MAVKIVTDSTSNLPPEKVAVQGITVVPSYIFFGSEEYKEGEGLSYPEFIQKLKQLGTSPQTAPPTAAEFFKIFEKLLQEADEVVSLHLTSKLSNIYRNATIAKDMVERAHPTKKVYTVDTQMVDFALGLLVNEADRLAKSGKSGQEIVAAVQAMQQKMGGYIYVDTLEFLKRGGRVSRLAAFFGSLMQVKPILKLEEGELRPAEKVAGKEKALEKILELLDGEIPTGSQLELGVGDALDPVEGDRFLELLKTRFSCFTTHRVTLCQSVSIHAGPGALAVFYRIL